MANKQNSHLPLWLFRLAIVSTIFACFASICLTYATAKDADQPKQSVTSETNNTSPDHLRVVEMKLSGSMCSVCLHELAKKLQNKPGILKVKIERSVGNYAINYQSLGLNNWALAQISYDAQLTSLPDIQEFFLNQGYHPFKIISDQQLRK